ncbi:hypothetical protein I7I48_10853 [Histoplasma ohiense]|nr:hypothetical protein I7I48_10853 [Histoplasma ohiense (nom. inval.)]
MSLSAPQLDRRGHCQSRCTVVVRSIYCNYNVSSARVGISMGNGGRNSKWFIDVKPNINQMFERKWCFVSFGSTQGLASCEYTNLGINAHVAIILSAVGTAVRDPGRDDDNVTRAHWDEDARAVAVVIPTAYAQGG